MQENLNILIDILCKYFHQKFQQGNFVLIFNSSIEKLLNCLRVQAPLKLVVKLITDAIDKKL